jgi:hypothetical protein
MCGLLCTLHISSYPTEKNIFSLFNKGLDKHQSHSEHSDEKEEPSLSGIKPPDATLLA